MAREVEGVEHLERVLVRLKRVDLREVVAGLVPATSLVVARYLKKLGVAGTSPAMTPVRDSMRSDGL
jgi:hypothetical protein